MKIKPITSPKSNALARGAIAGSVSFIIYLLIVVITTPSLPPLAALNAAIRVNSIIVFGLAVGIGIQVYLLTYRKSLGCRIANGKKGILGNSCSTLLSSFFSFFSLVPLGCCGSWLLILSLLPSVFGSSLSVFLIQYSKLLSYLGLLIVLGYTTFIVIRMKTELKRIKKVDAERKILRE